MSSPSSTVRAAVLAPRPSLVPTANPQRSRSSSRAYVLSLATQTHAVIVKLPLYPLYSLRHAEGEGTLSRFIAT